MGIFRGKPLRYRQGHGNASSPERRAAAIGTGLCACGCGQPTPIATYTNVSNNAVKGHPRRFIPSHTSRRKNPMEMHVVDASGCWLWSGRVNPINGYGYFGPREAHRVVYEKAKGPIPPGHEIDHLCRVRNCVNPNHLEAVLPIVNKRRSTSTKLTIEQAAVIRALTASGRRHKEIAAVFGISRRLVGHIHGGTLWAD